MLDGICIVCRGPHQRSCALRRFAGGHESHWRTSSRHKIFVGTGEDDSRVLDQLLDEVLRHAAGRGIHLLTCKVQPLQFAAIHALERHGFLLMDTLLDFFFDFSRTPFDKISPPQRLDGLRFAWQSGRFA